jgi:hypothetical protein
MNHVLAYIDPGAGSLLLQAVIAGVLSVPFFFRRSLSATLSRFRRVKAPTGASSDTQAQDATD